MSVALLLTNSSDNSMQKTSNLLSPAPPPYSWSLLGKCEGPAPPPSSKISWSFDLPWNPENTPRYQRTLNTNSQSVSKPRKARLKPRPTIGQSPVHATQYTGRLTARPPTRLTSGKRRPWCQILRGTLIPSNKRKDKKSNTNAYGRKGRERKRLYTNACGKERKNRQQMPMEKKERPNHKWWWKTKEGCPNQASKRKMAALIRQANSWHQMEETKQLKPPQNPKRWPTCKHKVEDTHHQITILIDYCLQQMSGRLQSKP